MHLTVNGSFGISDNFVRNHSSSDFDIQRLEEFGSKEIDMISGKNMYEVLSALVPLYMAMFLAFRSVQWWGMSTPMQCVGINRYVAMFAVPVHGFNFIATSNLYEINYKFIAADTIQKVAILLALGVLSMIVSAKPIGGGRFGPEWSITLFSLSSLPNTLIFGIPLLEAMYGKPAGILIVQVIVFQSVIWYNLFRLLFEYRAAKILINECFPGSVGEITSIKVDSDVVSLSGIEPLEMDVDRDVDGRFHVGVRRSPLLPQTTTCFGYLQSGATPRERQISVGSRSTQYNLLQWDQSRASTMQAESQRAGCR
ncbi:auxin efflux carrier component 2-like [Punica granatum]|uniref:Auxin efflux carrier component 2-like n=1 Tax=Punica granatum TaxID=22663 RepID=A0A6P8DPP4_PUNGR|nr:auxin efflux carrier component 2-like [Punica granatum]